MLDFLSNVFYASYIVFKLHAQLQSFIIRRTHCHQCIIADRKLSAHFNGGVRPHVNNSLCPCYQPRLDMFS